MITQGYGSQNIEWIHMDHLGPEGVRIQLCILCKQYKVFHSSTWHHKSEMSSTNLPIDQIWSIWITDELKMFCFYSVSVFSSAEPQPLHVYLNSLSWLHRLSQPILLSQWGGGVSITQSVVYFTHLFHTHHTAGENTASASDLFSACLHLRASVWCVPAGLPASKLQDERVGGRGGDGAYQGWPGLQTRPSVGPKSGKTKRVVKKNNNLCEDVLKPKTM